jgi:pimeloyl-ACP methyl ester carboxylesterase
VRSYLRSDGRRFAGRLKEPVRCPVLQVHGLDDPAAAAELAQISDKHVAASFTWEPLLGAGHFPHEERPHAFNASLLGWLSRQHASEGASQAS